VWKFECGAEVTQSKPLTPRTILTRLKRRLREERKIWGATPEQEERKAKKLSVQAH
jgi:hypothetical protein